MTRFLGASFPHEGVGNKVASMYGWDIHICLDPSLEDASFKAPLISHLESRELVLRNQAVDGILVYPKIASNLFRGHEVLSFHNRYSTDAGGIKALRLPSHGILHHSNHGCQPIFPVVGGLPYWRPKTSVKWTIPGVDKQLILLTNLVQ